MAIHDSTRSLFQGHVQRIEVALRQATDSLNLLLTQSPLIDRLDLEIAALAGAADAMRAVGEEVDDTVAILAAAIYQLERRAS